MMSHCLFIATFSLDLYEKVFLSSLFTGAFSPFMDALYGRTWQHSSHTNALELHFNALITLQLMLGIFPHSTGLKEAPLCNIFA